jgi:hypothetical protein
MLADLLLPTLELADEAGEVRRATRKGITLYYCYNTWRIYAALEGTRDLLGSVTGIGVPDGRTELDAVLPPPLPPPDLGFCTMA